jgi:hypothetical protein
MVTRALALVLLLASPALAQPHATVLPDRVLTGHGNLEFIPRFATYLPDTITVPAGQTVLLSGAVTKDAIEVAGTLRCSAPVTLSVTHLTILPGGTFDCQQNSVIVFRDVPIDTTKDPYQFGNGLINMGTLILKGTRTVTLFTTTSTDTASGSTLHGDFPADWQVGDELFLPDLRQMRPPSQWAPTLAPRREARVFITARTATTLTLSKPLDYTHQSVKKPDGTVVFRPRVANLTRSFSVMSENPAGARGHIINLGHNATWDVQNIGIYDVGRTTVATLDSTTANAAGAITHVGTNQVGKYAFHAHHTQGFGTIFRGNVLLDSGRTKWGHATHQTHDSLIENNITIGHVGAGFVTEDGNEVRNVYRGNVAAFHPGNGLSATDNQRPEINSPGSEGPGFWFHGVHNIIDTNESWNNAIGVQMLYTGQVVASIPSVPGGPVDTPFSPSTAAPISFDHNKAISNLLAGWETWNSPKVLLGTNLYAAHNGVHQVTAGRGGGSLHFKNLFTFADQEVGMAVDTTAGYNADVIIEGGEILGSGLGFRESFGQMVLKDVTLQNVVNINHMGATPAFSSFERVTHVPLGGNPKHYLLMSTRPESWMPATGSRYRILDWQGTGQDYRLFLTNSRRSLPAPQSNQWEVKCPVAGLTMGDCWDQYGLSYAGGSIADADTVALEGVLFGVARAGLANPLPVPRAVVSFPNTGAPAVVANGQVQLFTVLTGDPSLANQAVVIRVDGGQVSRYLPSQYQHPLMRHIPTTAIAEGPHTVTTWRETAAGVMIPASQSTFSYFVGAGTPPPPPPPPPEEVCGDGMTTTAMGRSIDEGCAPPTPAPCPCGLCRLGVFALECMP